MNHQSQADLLNSLSSIFPEFKREWDLDNENIEFPNDSLHSVYMSFSPFVSGIAPSPKQLKLLADLINGAVAAGGDAENAVATCFLEGLGPGPFLRSLRPLLTAETKARLHP